MLKLKEKDQNLTVVISFSKSHNRIVFSFSLCDVEKLDSMNALTFAYVTFKPTKC